MKRRYTVDSYDGVICAGAMTRAQAAKIARNAVRSGVVGVHIFCWETDTTDWLN